MRFILLCMLAMFPALAKAEPAHIAFGQHVTASASEPASFGSYAKGCLAGGAELRETSSGWQAMRLSRNRNWGHPEMIRFIERLSRKAQDIGWPRLYVGDIGQPRGGPMKSGHRSHQIGLDVDVWLRMPGVKKLSRKQRERISSHVVVAKNGVSLNQYWTRSHHQVIRAAAQDPAVARIFVNAAIKRQMCRDERDGTGRIDAPWLRKIRPWRGHNAHFHVRLACPAGSPGCRDQAPPPPGTGCGAELSKWFPKGQRSRSIELQKPSEESQEPATELTRSARRQLTLADLPNLCRQVLDTEGANVFASDAMPEPQAAALPVFSDRNGNAHEGYVGTRYFWRPAVDRNAAEQQRIVLKLQGRLPDGLKFVDRGGGNALLSGTPGTPGSFPLILVALRRGQETERQNVVLNIERLGTSTTAASAPIVASLDHQVRDFLTDFSGNECFLAVPAHVSRDRIDIEAFSDDTAPFYVFDDAFKSVVGIEANVGGRMVTRSQCGALAYLRSFPNIGPPKVVMDDPDRVLTKGQTVTLSVPETQGKAVSMLLIDAAGNVSDVSKVLKRDGDMLRGSVRPGAEGPHVVLLLEGVPGTLGSVNGVSRQVFQALRQQSGLRTSQASLSYFVVQ